MTIEKDSLRICLKLNHQWCGGVPELNCLYVFIIWQLTTPRNSIKVDRILQFKMAISGVVHHKKIFQCKSLNHKKYLKFSKPEEEQGKWHRQNVTSCLSIILMWILMKSGVNNLEAHSNSRWPRHPQPLYKIQGFGDWLTDKGLSVFCSFCH